MQIQRVMWLFILLVLTVFVITLTAVHWQYKFCYSGESFKSFIVAVLFTFFAFQFRVDHKVLFIILFFYVTIAMWSMFVVSITIPKRWAKGSLEDRDRMF